MHLHGRGRGGIHGWLRAQIHHCRQSTLSPIQFNPGGVDPQCREKLAAVHLKVGRRPAQFPAQAATAHHAPLKAKRASKQCPGGLQVASLEG